MLYQRDDDGKVYQVRVASRRMNYADEVYRLREIALPLVFVGEKIKSIGDHQAV